ncbi:hypothetical protein [Desertivirga brevis]|uniref:hypothetical protein n=1 Tax=Desertivirga brevis TaxID=2810310 RepID=UPI001A96B05E|nr:hypothetical protein [Pedobacter sp. SYSU D00873]
MNEIKSLADQIRESIKNGEQVSGKEGKSSGRKKTKAANQAIEQMLQQMLSHQLTGTEKLLIRLDDRTLFLLKQLKVTRGVDMNKAISYMVKIFIESTPDLTKYIKESINTLEL